ncbi:MAG: hypothetical protein WAU81_05595 [Candidatus Aminicenantales bacterium]
MDQEKIEIDYDHIDVARIIDQIKKKVAAEAADAPRTSRDDSPSLPGLDLEAGQGRARRILLRLMSPLKPLIKLLILPVAEENRRTVLILDHANRRIDRLEQNIERLDRLQEYTKLLHHLCHNIVVEMSKLKIEEETLKTKTRIMEKDFDYLGKREKALEKEVFK